MLELINNKMKGWFTWTIIIVISAVFVFTGVSYFFSGSHVSPQAVVKVGDVNVSRQQFQQSMMQSQSGLSGKALEQFTLKQLIQQQLLAQGAQKSGIIITPLALQNAIFTNPAFQENGNYSQQRFDQISRYYGGQGVVESIIASNLMATGFVMPMTNTIFALPSETKQASALLTQSRTITTLTFDNSTYLSQVTVSDQEAQAYYQTNQSQFVTPATAQVEFVTLNSADFAGNYQPTQEAIEHFYQQNQANLVNPQSYDGIVVAFKSDADKDAILATLASGGHLNAQQQAQVSTSALQSISMQNAKTDTEKALLQLSRNNPYAQVGKNEYVVLTQVSPSSTMTFEQAKPTIVRILTGRHALQNYNQVLAQLDANNYQTLLRKYNISGSKEVTLTEGQAMANINPKLLDTVFASNQSFGYIDLNNTSAVIYRVIVRTPQQPQTFDQVKSEITAKIKTDKANTLEAHAAQEMLVKLNTKALTLEQAQQQYPVKSERRNIVRGNPTMTAEQVAAIYRAPIGTYQLLPSDDAVIVFAVNSVSSGDQPLPTQQVEAFYAQLEFQSYLQSLKNTIPVEVNTALFND